jgi:hypothetical protein
LSTEDAVAVSAGDSKVPKTVTITSEVDPLWIEYITTNTDLFSSNYCGYWLRGAEHDDALGWLVWESLGKPTFDKEPNRRKALAAWRKGGPLPENWFRFDAAFALKSWGEGVKMRGEKWFENGDANTYDAVIQQALFGEQRYG